MNNAFCVLYVAITLLWAGIVFIDYDKLEIKEKFALTIFWPINVLLWLLITVPKYFIQDAIKRIKS